MRPKRLITATLCALICAFCAVSALASEIEDAVENELLTGLLKEAARIIKDAYGIDGKSGNRLSVVWDDDASVGERLGSGTLAAAGGHFGFPYDTVLILNADYFRTPALIGSQEGMRELRLTVLHEMTHGMQFPSKPGLLTFIHEDPTARNNGMAQFLYEGMAEYAAGGNSRILGYARDKKGQPSPMTDDQILKHILDNMRLAVADQNGIGGYTTFEEQKLFYIGSYLATRWFDTESKKKGGTGVKGFIEELEAHGSAQGDVRWVIDGAFNKASNGRWTEWADFVNEVMNQENNPTSAFYQFVAGVLKEDENVDAGRVGGWYANGKTGAKQTLADVSRSLSGGARDEVPLNGYGFVSTTIFGKVFETGQTPPGGDPDDGIGGAVPAPEAGAHDGEVDAAVSDSSWSSSTGGDLTVRVDVDFAKFTDVVSLDGVLLARDTQTVSRDYGARSGSTIITIWERTLRTHVKRSGAHYVSVGFTDGAASHKIDATVAEAPGQGGSGPRTPSGGGGGCAAGTALSAACALLVITRRRGR